MEKVTSLPKDIIYLGDGFLRRYRQRMTAAVFPAFLCLAAPDDKSVIASVLLLLFYSWFLLGDGIIQTLWRHARVLWWQLQGSLLFAFVAVIALRHFDLVHWLVNEFGFIPDGEVKPLWAIAAFLPYTAAFYASFDTAELAFYRSKGFEYSGFLGDLRE